MAEGIVGRKTIKILADSRGRGLLPILQEIGGPQYLLEIYPGASIPVLADKMIDGTIDSPNYDLIIIFGGICSVTKIVYRPHRIAVPRYTSANEILNQYKGSCESLLKRAADHSSIPILLSPIVGMDLVAYAGQCSDQLSDQLFDMQVVIDEAVAHINRFIRDSNDRRGLVTPNVASCIHRCRGRGKGYRSHYRKLTDGCHPSEEVKQYWAKGLNECCCLNLNFTA